MPNLLFHRRKKQNFNFEVIPENLKDENQDDKPEVVIFESCKEDLLEIIEGKVRRIVFIIINKKVLQINNYILK